MLVVRDVAEARGDRHRYLQQVHLAGRRERHGQQRHVTRHLHTLLVGHLCKDGALVRISQPRCRTKAEVDEVVWAGRPSRPADFASLHELGRARIVARSRHARRGEAALDEEAGLEAVDLRRGLRCRSDEPCILGTTRGPLRPQQEPNEAVLADSKRDPRVGIIHAGPAARCAERALGNAPCGRRALGSRSCGRRRRQRGCGLRRWYGHDAEGGTFRRRTHQVPQAQERRHEAANSNKDNGGNEERRLLHHCGCVTRGSG